MDAPAQDPRDESIPDLFARLVEDGRAYARAELELVRQIAKRRAGKARTGLVALVAGGVLLFSSLTALVLGLVLGLATLIGPLAAGLAVAAALAAAGYLLVRIGLSGVAALGGDEEEREALERAEKQP